MKPLLLSILLLFVMSSRAFTQALRFGDEVNAFKSIDSLRPPLGKYILLLGSSSFALWKDAEKAFGQTRMINRAFGGSTLSDLWAHRHAIVDAYRPVQVVLYCGENDFAEHDSVSVGTVLQRFEQFYLYLRQVHPKCVFTYISMKPSPSRRYLLPKFLAANEAIRLFISKQPNASYIDVFAKMLEADGQPSAKLFQPDSLHMNAAGYAIWEKAISSKLVSTHD